MDDILDEKTYENRVLHYASFSLRSAAFLTDMLLAGIISFGLYYILGLAPSYAEFLSACWWQVCMVLSFYFIYFDGSEKNATPGKQIMNIRMLNEEKRDVDFTTSALHFVLSLILLPVSFSLLFNEKKQTPADKICKVFVIRTV